jgi:hypothetical protein
VLVVVVRLLSCSDREPILLDWQFFGSGGPAIDIAYFFLMSLAPDPLLEERLIRCYIDALHAAGVPGKKKPAFFPPVFMLKMMGGCQDRLGTGIGKPLKNGLLFRSERA